MRVLKTITDFCSVVIILVLGTTLLLLILPLYLILLPFIKRNERKFEAAYCNFLNTQNENTFFVYTSKKKTKKFVEDALLPNFRKEIKVVFLDGETPRSDLETRFVSRLLNDQKVVGGFPWLIKISSGRPVVNSLNNTVYNAMRDGNPQAILSLINSQ
ncbi:MAG: hypothetical protein IAE95_14825 [Chitinophagaceae bacterium]|nr:hypothetical protein [Chitinophagaceae bacterium]